MCCCTAVRRCPWLQFVKQLLLDFAQLHHALQMGLLFLAPIKAADFAGENNRCVQAVTAEQEKAPNKVRFYSSRSPFHVFQATSTFLIAEPKTRAENRPLKCRLGEIRISALPDGAVSAWHWRTGER